MYTVTLTQLKTSVFIIIGSLLFTNQLFSQDFSIQHVQSDVPRTGSSVAITPVASLNTAFAIPNNNRKTHAGTPNSGNNLNGRDMSGAIQLTATNNLNYYREASSVNTNTRFNSSIIEYTGIANGPNAFAVRGRYTVSLNGSNNSTTLGLSGVLDAEKCIPFITGIINSSNSADADSGTAVAYLENNSTMRVLKGSDANNVTVYITLVEFIGANWTVLHGDSGNTSSDTNTITLRTNANGTGNATNVSNWSDAIIFGHHIGDANNDGNNDALADNWPKFFPGNNNQQVAWEFDSDHDSNGNNRHFVHVLINEDLNVTRFQDTENDDNETAINITSANLSSLDQAMIIGSSITSGTGIAYGRGWRNYYLKSTTQAAHWAHRSGNDLSHEIQIIDFTQVRPPLCISTITTFPYNESYESGLGQWIQNSTDDTSNWVRRSGGTPSGGTGPSGATDGNFYLYTESTSPYGNTAIIESPCFDLTGGSNHQFSFSYHMFGAQMGNLRLELSTDGQTYPTVVWSKTGQVQTGNNSAWTRVDLDLSAFSGKIIKLRFNGTTGNGTRSDMAIDRMTLTSIAPRPEIEVRGNALLIASGDTTPGITDHTDFDVTEVGSPIIKTYTINNLGNANLNIASIALSNPAFSITGSPYNPNVATDASTTFTVQFNASSSGTFTSTVTINSSDTDEAAYTFTISANADLFFDSDGDGVYDRNDLDDDNDGILDGEECGFVNANNFSSLSSGSSGDLSDFTTTFDPAPGNDRIVLLVLGSEYSPSDNNDGLSENATVTLGGVPMNQLGIRYGGKRDAQDDNNYLSLYYLRESELAGLANSNLVVTAVGINQAFAGHIETLENVDQNVTIYNDFFGISPDDQVVTFNSPNVNLNLDETAFLFANSGSEGSTYAFTQGIKIAEVGASGSSLGGMQYYPDSSGSVSLSGTIDISRRSSGVVLKFKAVDDVSCTDTDGDGVPNHLDLDSDNDGIPDIVEAGFAQYSNGKGVIQNFVDTNNNGVHDPLESSINIPLDSDNDGAPNYVDLDSDNDSIFDVDESGAGNAGNSTFQNGDGDVNGDGVGDGNDTDSVRRTDINSDGLVDFLPDGILDVFDFYNGSNFNTSYGNNNQGLGSPQFVIDTDNDGTPDYIDLTSNGSDFDISNTIYADLDSDNDGMVDGATDADADGLLDLFDSDDITFGSPRFIDSKLLIYFDGRNDYIEDAPLYGGTNEASMMGWIKVDPTASGNQRIFGQNSIYLMFTNGNRVYARVNSITVQSAVLPKNQWIHVSMTYSNSNNRITLYINGEEVQSKEADGSINSDASLFTMGKRAGANNLFFKGQLDEVRLFNKALSADEIHKMVYQEIENNGGNVRGIDIPQDITDFIDTDNINTLSWNSLLRYYRLDNLRGDITDDLTTPSIDESTGARLYNIKIFKPQSAPMPFITQDGGSLETAVSIPEDGVNGMDAITYDWSIVKVEHFGVTFNADQKHLGLFVNDFGAEASPIELSVENDSELNISWYLKLDGTIDLDGESQLVQGLDSYLDPTSKGRIERDQQGTADTYTYNYWSSPVGAQNATTNNANYKLADILKDGTNSNNPMAVNFVSSLNGNSASPISLSRRWLYKYNNLPENDYSQWVAINHNSDILAGEGYTMKGPGSGSITDLQNYVFSGKPNNGDIELPINVGNDYLIGNPYPSALDAHQFILDNGPVIEGAEPGITGTLYFWHHWGGGSHALADYQGGYATYNLSGSTPSATFPNNHPDGAMGGNPNKRPGRYIPVSQGFFVAGSTNGTIKFNNGQRVFAKEGTNSSVFLRNSDSAFEDPDNADLRMKFRIALNSVGGIHRQLLLTIDDEATTSIDWGFDGMHNEEQIDDMFWMIDSQKFNIQGSNDVSPQVSYPLGLSSHKEGLNTISVEDLENVPNSIDIYVHDIEKDTYHNLRESDFQFFLPGGEFLEKFELTFGILDEGTLNTKNQNLKSLEVFYANQKESLIIVNPNIIEINSLEIVNMLGQSITIINNISELDYSEYQVENLSAGTYIIKMDTESGSVSKKVLVN